MVQLGCNLSEPLLALLAAGEIDLDWIKLSRDDVLEAEVQRCQGIRPALVHTLRQAGMPPAQFAAIDWVRLSRMVLQAGSPHIAIHFEIRHRHLDGLSPDDAGAIISRMTGQIAAARDRLPVPLLVENVPWRPGQEILALCVDPAVIRAALEETNTGLLLDTAHLRCAAENQGRDPREYAAALPLDRVREIHVCGPRPDESGLLRDRHLELQEPDYALLAWLLERTQPQMVTLEYGGSGHVFDQPGMTDPDAIRRQLHRLKGMLS